MVWDQGWVVGPGPGAQPDLARSRSMRRVESLPGRIETFVPTSVRYSDDLAFIQTAILRDSDYLD